MLLVIRRRVRGGGAMSEVTRRFFDELERHGHERVLRKTTGTLRFDLEHDHEIDHWLVEIRGGAIRVSQQNSEADTVIRSDSAFFEQMVRGEVKPLPAWLRNDITSEGEFRFIVLLER